MTVRPVILADADNTLWDTDAVFADAQLGMLAEIDGRFAEVPREVALAHVRRHDQALAQIDHRHLRYPPSMLARSLALGARGVDPAMAARAVASGNSPKDFADDHVGPLAAAYFDALSAVPALLRGVIEGLTAAADAAIEVWILTEGSADRQRDRARSLGIDGLVRGVSETQKNAEQFARQRRRFLPADLYVVGDQPDRDIAPAQSAGCIGVLVPSRFRPDWVDEAAWKVADFVSDDFASAVHWIVNHAAGSGQRRSAALG